MANQQKVSEIYASLVLHTAQYQAGLKEASAATKKFSTDTKGSMEETRGSIVLLGDQIGVAMPRELSRFLATLPGVATAMSAAFNAVAIIALISVVVEAGKKVYEFASKNEEAAKKNAAAAQAFTAELVKSNAELAISNDRLEQDIAKLSKKPENNLKLALDEAKLSAIDLADQLDKATSKERELLDAGNAAWYQRLTGTASNESVKSGLKQYQQSYQSINTNADQQLESAKSLNDEQKIEAQRKQELLTLSQNYYNSLTKEIAARQQYQALRKSGDTDSDLGYQFERQYGGGDQSKIIPALQQLQGGIGLGATNLQLQMHHDSLQNQDQSLQAKQANSDASAKIDTERLKSLQNFVAQKEQLFGKDNSWEAQYWTAQLSTLHSGTDAYQQVLDKAHAAQMAVLASLHKQIQASKVTETEPTFGGSSQDSSELTAATEKQQASQASLNQEWADAAEKLGLLTGAITPHEAALAAASQHTEEYKNKLAALQTQMVALQANDAWAGTFGPDNANLAKEKNLQTQEDQLSGKYKIQQLSDAQDTLTTTWSGMVDSVWDELIKRAEDTQQQLARIATQFVDGINSELAKGLTGQKMDFGKVFQGSAQSLAKTGLQSAEGMGLKALGLGGTKRDGSSESSALFVRNVGSGGAGKSDADPLSSLFGSTMPKVSGPSGMSGQTKSLISGVGGGLMGMLNNSNWASSLFGGNLFGSGSVFGHFATGGDAPAGVPIDVGELGPERLTLPSPAHITPTRDLQRGGITMNVDARGTDPALTKANFQRSMTAVHAQSVHDASKAMMEKQRRTAH